MKIKLMRKATGLLRGQDNLAKIRKTASWSLIFSEGFSHLNSTQFNSNKPHQQLSDLGRWFTFFFFFLTLHR